jgi:hypothetical protein
MISGRLRRDQTCATGKVRILRNALYRVSFPCNRWKPIRRFEAPQLSMNFSFPIQAQLAQFASQLSEIPFAHFSIFLHHEKPLAVGAEGP